MKRDGLADGEKVIEAEGAVDPLSEFFAGPDDVKAGRSPSEPPAHGRRARTLLGHENEHLSFMLGDEEYAVPIKALREVVRPVPITPVPRTPSYVLGIITLRGTVLPVIDVRVRLGLATSRPERHARILVLESGDGPVGLWTDRIVQVVRAKREPGEPPATKPDSGLLVGVLECGRRLLILDLDAALRVDGQASSDDGDRP